MAILPKFLRDKIREHFGPKAPTPAVPAPPRVAPHVPAVARTPSGQNIAWNVGDPVEFDSHDGSYTSHAVITAKYDELQPGLVSVPDGTTGTVVGVGERDIGEGGLTKMLMVDVENLGVYGWRMNDLVNLKTHEEREWAGTPWTGKSSRRVSIVTAQSLEREDIAAAWLLSDPDAWQQLAAQYPTLVGLWNKFQAGTAEDYDARSAVQQVGVDAVETFMQASGQRLAEEGAEPKMPTLSLSRSGYQRYEGELDGKKVRIGLKERVEHGSYGGGKRQRREKVWEVKIGNEIVGDASSLGAAKELAIQSVFHKVAPEEKSKKGRITVIAACDLAHVDFSGQPNSAQADSHHDQREQLSDSSRSPGRLGPRDSSRWPGRPRVGTVPGSQHFRGRLRCGDQPGEPQSSDRGRIQRDACTSRLPEHCSPSSGSDDLALARTAVAPKTLFVGLSSDDLARAFRRIPYLRVATGGREQLHVTNTKTGKAAPVPQHPSPILVQTILKQLGVPELEFLDAAKIKIDPQFRRKLTPETAQADPILTEDAYAFLDREPVEGYDLVNYLGGTSDVAARGPQGVVLLTEAFFNLDAAGRQQALERATSSPPVEKFGRADPCLYFTAEDLQPQEILDWRGLKLAIEHYAGETRGEEWGEPRLVPFMYGYFPGTLAEDGDAIDFVLGNDAATSAVYVAFQRDPQTNEFVQFKAMLNFGNQAAAEAAFKLLWPSDAFAGMIALPADEFADYGLRQLEGTPTETETDEPDDRLPGDKLPGGLSDAIPESEYDPEALDEGAKVETEHVSDESMAREIAKDHLTEDPGYYEKLKKLEARTTVVAARDLAAVKYGEDKHGGVFIPLPESLAKNWPKNRGSDDVSPPHFTMLYLGPHDEDLLTTVTKVAKKVAKNHAPIPILLRRGVDYFDNKDGVPIAHKSVHARSEEMMARLHRDLRREFEAAGVPVQHFDEFKAHATMRYLDPSEPIYSGPVPEGGFVASQIEVWGWDDDLEFPLTGVAESRFPMTYSGQAAEALDPDVSMANFAAASPDVLAGYFDAPWGAQFWQWVSRSPAGEAWLDSPAGGDFLIELQSRLGDRAFGSSGDLARPQGHWVVCPHCQAYGLASEECWRCGMRPGETRVTGESRTTIVEAEDLPGARQSSVMVVAAGLQRFGGAGRIRRVVPVPGSSAQRRRRYVGDTYYVPRGADSSIAYTTKDNVGLDAEEVMLHPDAKILARGMTEYRELFGHNDPDTHDAQVGCTKAGFDAVRIGPMLLVVNESVIESRQDPRTSGDRTRE